VKPNNFVAGFEPPAYLRELYDCRLCEWRCSVNRLEGGKGVCGVGIPVVASSMLHPAPPASYDAFLVGCNFSCLSCQNWMVANYPFTKVSSVEGYYSPQDWAAKAVKALNSFEAGLIGADRLFFTGGEPTCSLPWVEEVVRQAKKIDKNIKINFDTNGFLTKESLKKVLGFVTSITYDLKAYNNDVHQALTGAPVEPVLRNAEQIARYAKEKLWEFRILVIPGVHESEVGDLCEFVAGLDPGLPVAFLAFRPNFVLENHPGATRKLMERCLEIARRKGLENVAWSGLPDIPPGPGFNPKDLAGKGEEVLMGYAKKAGCTQRTRLCGACASRLAGGCKLRKHIPRRTT